MEQPLEVVRPTTMPFVPHRHFLRVLFASGALLTSAPALSSVDSLRDFEDSESRVSDVEFTRWMASPAGKQFEVSSVELSRHNGFRWSLDQPFDVFVGHAVGDGLRFEARAGLVPHSDAWADLLTIDTTSDTTSDATNDATSDAALFGAEASLAVVAEFGPRRVSPWRLALGGGWGEADRAFVRAMDQSFTAGTSGTSDGEPSDGEAVIWLRLSRDF